MAKDFIIKNWEQGIGQSPYEGFAQMVNTDIYSKPGCLKISNKLERDLGADGIVTGLLKWTVQNPDNGETYSVDDDGKLYKRTTGGVWSVVTGHGNSNANGEGLAIWKGYLFYARRTRLDVMELSSGTWTNNWDALNTGSPYNLESSFPYNLHPMMAAQDDFLYIGNAQYVDVLRETLTTPFTPTPPGNPSYQYDAHSLAIRSDYRITCLEEQGSNIVIGTLIGNNSVFNIADVFIWDGSSNTVLLNGTIRLVENGVKMMKNANNILNIIAGTGVPRIFNAVTSQSQEVKRFNNIDVPFTQRLSLFPAAIELKEGEVLFGIGQITSNNLPHMGVYALRNNAYVLRYLISTGRDGSTDGLQIGVVKSISANRILVGWRDDDDANQFGVDVLQERYYTDYTCYVESPYYTVGDEGNPKTFEMVEVRMGKKLRTGDGVKIYGRKSLDDTYVLLATFDTPTYVGRSTFKTKVSNLSDLVDFQFKVALTTDEDSEISPELKEIVFY